LVRSTLVTWDYEGAVVSTGVAVRFSTGGALSSSLTLEPQPTKAAAQIADNRTLEADDEERRLKLMGSPWDGLTESGGKI